jgi:hypothetical protein
MRCVTNFGYRKCHATGRLSSLELADLGSSISPRASGPSACNRAVSWLIGLMFQQLIPLKVLRNCSPSLIRHQEFELASSQELSLSATERRPVKDVRLACCADRPTKNDIMRMNAATKGIRSRQITLDNNCIAPGIPRLPVLNFCRSVRGRSWMLSNHPHFLCEMIWETTTTRMV